MSVAAWCAEGMEKKIIENAVWQTEKNETRRNYPFTKNPGTGRAAEYDRLEMLIGKGANVFLLTLFNVFPEYLKVC